MAAIHLHIMYQEINVLGAWKYQINNNRIDKNPDFMELTNY